MIDSQKIERIEVSLEKIEQIGTKIADHEDLKVSLEKRLEELNDLILNSKEKDLIDQSVLQTLKDYESESS